jgi:hypothetical protein
MMVGSNIATRRLPAGFSWLAAWLVLALLVAGLGGWLHHAQGEHAGHDHGSVPQHTCVICLLNHGHMVADGGVGQLTVFVLALVFAAFISEVRPACFARFELPSARGPPV